MNQYRREIDPETGHLLISLPLTNTANPLPPALPLSPPSSDPTPGQIPPAVLQYERQLRKIRASSRASRPLPPLPPPLYTDDDMLVTNKPSGVLTVPGVNDNPSLLTHVFRTYNNAATTPPPHRDTDTDDGIIDVADKMIVHRLDMDTSGLVLFARTTRALKNLHAAFREHKVTKSYVALVCGTVYDEEGVIDLALQRDHAHPPFMRCATPRSEEEAREVVKGLQSAGYRKLMAKKAKESRTRFKVLGRERLDRGGGSSCEVTRLELVPVTGRTHQLRVHCAAMGHPIVADPAYGLMGEANANGGFEEHVMDEIAPRRASLNLQKDILEIVKERDMCMCLHAAELGLDHPVTGERMFFRTEPAF